ncbi:hypothetical protein Tco_0461287 [Tanacetum coccineum]
MKVSLRNFRSQHHTGDSSEGAGITPEVPDESQAKSTNINEGAGITPEVPNVYKAASMIQDLKKDCGSEEDDVILTSEDQRTKSEKETTKSGISIDLDETDNEEDEHVDDETQRDEYGHEDEYVHEDNEYVHEEEEHVHDYVEEEFKDAEIAKTVEGDKELTNPNKAEVGKTKEAKGKKEQVDNVLPRVDQSKDASTQDNQAAALYFYNTEAKINSMLDIQIQHEVPNIQASSLLTIPILVIPEPIVLTLISEIIIEAPATTISPFIPEPQKSVSEIMKIKMEHASKQQLPEQSSKPFDQAA